MNCAICNRLARGYAWSNPEIPRSPVYRACSWDCLQLIYDRKGKLVNLDRFEQEAIEHASVKAGAYLESIGKFDLSQLTGEQWMDLLKLVYFETTSKTKELNKAFDDDVPY